MGVLSMPVIFGIIFIVIILCFVCLGMAIYVKRIAMRLLFVFAALVLALMLALFCWVEFSAQNEVIAERPQKQEVQQEEKKDTKAAQSYGNVEIKIDEATIPKDSATLKNPEKLDLEKGTRSNASPQVQQERHRVGRALAAVEQSLGGKLSRLDIRSHEINAAYERGLLDNYDALTKQSQIKMQQAEFIVQAMQEKLDILASARGLSAEDTEPDRRRIEARLLGARQKYDEYKNALAELNANPEVFHSL